ncbi:MAG TPA: glycosyltransferase family 2 protein [Armatimonadota bacterium]|jgi:glycosyltransferase involved in cell wall biosynthesis
MNLRVAAIIPAYNEETRITRVLEAVTSSSAISEIWVVDDGSGDRTYQEASAVPGVKALRLRENLGKGAAMMAGALQTNVDALLFLDADLSGLTPNHIADLVEPVVSGRADMTVGVFRGGRFLTDLAQKLAPHISGQRCMLRSSFLEASHVSELRYGVEMALYRHAQVQQLRIESVTLLGVTHPMKEEKIGYIRGTIARIHMYVEVIGGSLAPTIEARRQTITRLLRETFGTR